MDFDYIDFLSSALKEKALVNLVDEYKYQPKYWENNCKVYSSEYIRLKKKLTLTFKYGGMNKSIKDVSSFQIFHLDYGVGDYKVQRSVLCFPYRQKKENVKKNLLVRPSGNDYFCVKNKNDFYYWRIEYSFDPWDVELTKFFFTIKKWIATDIHPDFKNLTYKQYEEEDWNVDWMEQGNNELMLVEREQMS